MRHRTGESGRVFVRDLATGKRRDLTHEEDVAFWAWAIVEVLRHTGIRIEELLELTHHSFVAYTVPTTGEVVPMLQIAPSKTDRERLLLVSPELGEVLTAIIFRVRAGQAALPLVSAYDVFEQVWSPPMPFLFQRRHGTEHHALTRSFVRTCLIRALTTAALTDVSNQPLAFNTTRRHPHPARVTRRRPTTHRRATPPARGTHRRPGRRPCRQPRTDDSAEHLNTRRPGTRGG